MVVSMRLKFKKQMEKPIRLQHAIGVGRKQRKR
jgi:hypothetical protein